MRPRAAALTLAAALLPGAAGARTNPSSLQIKVYKIAFSPNADCSGPITVVDDSASPQYVDFLAGPDLGSGSLPAGTYPCVIIEMSDQLRFTPAAADGTNCAAGVQYTIDICRTETSRLVDGTPVTCHAGAEDRMAVYLSQASAAINGGTGLNAFLPPTNASDPVNGIRLFSPVVVSADTSGTLVFDGRGRVRDTGSRCEIGPPYVAFVSSSTNLLAQAAALPPLSALVAAPSDTFYLKSSDLAASVSRAFPFKGSATSCAHNGAHTHFTNTGAPYALDVLAPADGFIWGADPCNNYGGIVPRDKYDILLAFAQSSGGPVAFDLSLEPLDGYLCSHNGDVTQDNGFYASMIYVSTGQWVAKGQVIASMYKPNDGSDGAHIHSDVVVVGGHGPPATIACPNIFNAAVTNAFGARYGGETCNGTPFPSPTFCYKPSAGEDLTGLGTVP